jgi:hypothetical protein
MTVALWLRKSVARHRVLSYRPKVTAACMVLQRPVPEFS